MHVMLHASHSHARLVSPPSKACTHLPLYLDLPSSSGGIVVAFSLFCLAVRGGRPKSGRPGLLLLVLAGEPDDDDIVSVVSTREVP